MAKAENAITPAKEIKPQVSKGRGGKHNFPAAIIQPESDEDKAIVSNLLGEVFTEYKQPKVTSDAQLQQRLDDYFTRCAQRGQIPTVEEMCMATGYTSSTCWDWEHGRNKGFSSETSEIMKKAKEFLKTFDAKMVVSGKLNFLAYCFRAKNYYGMVDKQEHVITPNTVDENYSAENIRDRYLLEKGGILHGDDTAEGDS